MSWIRESSLNFLQNLALQIVKQGNVPQHIAFIMDGNRRFATRNRMQKTEGHAVGFDKLAETLKWCQSLGVKEVTVYAFSIENFKRSQEEVDGLMELARLKFQKLLEEKDKLKSEGVRIRVIGDLSLVPDDLHQLIAEAMYVTKENDKVQLNVAFSYTGRDDMTEAARRIVQGVETSRLSPEDITTELIGRSMYTEDSPPPELLIRTSGEVRLSDFLLWQCSTSIIYFTPVLWPDFTIWELLKAVFHFQRHREEMRVVRGVESQLGDWVGGEGFLRELYQQRLTGLQAVIKT